MLARFVCPASRLGELEADDRRLTSAPALSVVLDGGDWRDTPFRVEAVEMVGAAREDLADVETFCEVPLDEGWRDTLAAVAAAGGEGEAALRRRERSRRVEEVAAFFVAARDLELAVQGDRRAAPPGALRARARLPQPPHGRRLAREAGAGEAELRAVLAERDPAALRDAARATAAGCFVSIGSCSFSEPVEDLQALGLL